MPIELYFILMTLGAIAFIALVVGNIFLQHNNGEEDTKQITAILAVLILIILAVSWFLPNLEDNFYASFIHNKGRLEELAKECPNLEYSKCKEKREDIIKDIEESYDDYVRYLEYRFSDSLILEKIQPMLL